MYRKPRIAYIGPKFEEINGSVCLQRISDFERDVPCVISFYDSLQTLFADVAKNKNHIDFVTFDLEYLETMGGTSTFHIIASIDGFLKCSGHQAQIVGIVGDTTDPKLIQEALQIPEIQALSMRLGGSWPYDPGRFRDQPTPRAYADAQRRTITNYEVLYGNQEIMEVLNFGRPVLIGMTIFSDFQFLTQGDSVVAMPDAGESSIGSHAMCLLGYDQPLQRFLAKNSFGVTWGDSGYCWIPFEYMTAHCFDRWCFAISDQDMMLLG